jgi:hypothetical protein
MVLRFGGIRSPLESTSSSSSETVGAIPALANTWSILPYCFSAALNLQTISEWAGDLAICLTKRRLQVDLLLPICYINLRKRYRSCLRLRQWIEIRGIDLASVLDDAPEGCKADPR